MPFGRICIFSASVPVVSIFQTLCSLLFYIFYDALYYFIWEVAKNLARIHLIPYDELKLSLKYLDCEYRPMNWNTDCIYYHLTTAWGGGNKRAVAKELGIEVSQLDND